MRLLICLIALSFFALPGVNAQTEMTVKGGTFSTTSGRMFWMGSNYRKEWNTPVKVPVMNLATEKGGLTPVKRGGGKQTKSLRLEDASGREYTIRTVQKFITSKTLPGDLQSEAAADLVSDGISASYPYAALSVQPLADAAGVKYGKVKLVYIGDDPKLGEFRADFANSLVTFEERLPDGYTKAFDTDEVVEKLEDDNDNKVDQHALLRARLLDMFVMDLDRHEDQWNWVAVENANGKGKTYLPIPKDRDQAFYINDGVLPGFVKGRSLVPQLEGFKASARSITRFNFAARNLDRFFLNELSEADWKAAAEKFVSQMTDEVIERAIAQQPAEIRSISGPTIANTLKERRNNIVREAMEYYTFITQTVSITGSDKKELYTVTRNSDGTAAVVVHKIEKDGTQGPKMYERTFYPQVTEEIRLYGFDGEDKFVMNGDNDKIKVRLIGGGGEDVFENTSKQRGAIIYDRADGNNKVTGRFTDKMANDTMVNSFDRLSYKYAYQSVFATIGYNPDDGIFLGPTFKFVRHGFRRTPHKSLHQFKASFAFSTKAFNINYHNEFISALGDNTDIITDIDYRGPNGTSNFFGYGVNSIYDKTKTGKFRFYRIRYDLGDVSLQFRQRLSKTFTLSFGPSFQFYNMDSTDELNKIRNVVLNTIPSGLNPATVFEKQSYIGAKLSIILDSRDNLVLPEKGVNWVNTIRLLKGLGDNSYDKVTQINSDFTFYFNLIHDRLTFVNRTGFGTTLGDEGFEFFHAQYLGSDDNLRGYRKQRFAGKTKFYNQAEMRLRLANFRTYLFPGALGIFAFVDAGRVWVENDPNKKLLSGYGGGFWISPLRRIMLSVSYAISSEDKIPLVALGWQF